MRRSQVHDLAIAAVLVVVTSVFVAVGDGGEDPTALTYAIALPAAAVTAFRRWSPLIVVALISAARILVMAQADNEHALLPVAMVGLYTAARYGTRKSSLVVASIIGLNTAIFIAALSDETFVPEFLPEAALVAVPLAIGDAVRSRSERVAQLIDSEAAARVQAERIRIARDLHDVVAHGLSTIAIHSGVAAHLLDSDPDQAREALEVINATGKTSLEELRAMVGVLRSTDDAPLRPTPADPNDLSELLANAAAIGIQVTVDTSGEFPAGAGESCVVAMHRIIQEALTNIVRHAGPVATELRIRHNADHVDLTITNVAGAQPDTRLESTGVGIIGMRERAESLGGSLTAEPTPVGGFEVTAVLPYSTRRELAP